MQTYSKNRRFLNSRNPSHSKSRRSAMFILSNQARATWAKSDQIILSKVPDDLHDHWLCQNLDFSIPDSIVQRFTICSYNCGTAISIPSPAAFVAVSILLLLSPSSPSERHERYTSLVQVNSAPSSNRSSCQKNNTLLSGPQEKVTVFTQTLPHFVEVISQWESSFVRPNPAQGGTPIRQAFENIGLINFQGQKI
jgi:hypothetical protein